MRHFFTVNVVPVEFIRKKRQEGYEKKFYEISFETFVDENLRASNKTFTASSQTDMQTSQIIFNQILVFSHTRNLKSSFEKYIFKYSKTDNFFGD